MCYYLENRFFIVIGSCCPETSVPNTDEAIVGTTSEDAGVKAMPCYVLNGSIVMKYLKDRHVLSILLFVFLDIPNANAPIGKTRYK